MKIKKSELQKIIKEELERAIAEAMPASQMPPETPAAGVSGADAPIIEKIKAVGLKLVHLIGQTSMDIAEIINPNIVEEFKALESNDPQVRAQAALAIHDRFNVPLKETEEEEGYEEAQPTKPQSPKGGAYRDVQEDEE